MAASFLKAATKLGVAGGALYLTASYGLWSESEATLKGFQDVRDSVAPDANKLWKKVPSAPEIDSRIVDSWNRGVEKTFTSLSEAPEKMSDFVKTSLDSK